jgi:carbon-monoxide dehydrogenase small subunit
MSDGYETRPVEVTLNGRPASAEIPLPTMLAELLREHLGLAGTKISCDTQVCGACTVLVDGRPVSACTYLAVDAAGREIRTVEGLANADGSLAPIQQAFIDEFALQCGFCTPGFLMMATALLEENPSPTREQVKEHLEGNICRCSGYRPIVNAVLRAAGQPTESDDE